MAGVGGRSAHVVTLASVAHRCADVCDAAQALAAGSGGVACTAAALLFQVVEAGDAVRPAPVAAAGSDREDDVLPPWDAEVEAGESDLDSMPGLVSDSDSDDGSSDADDSGSDSDDTLHSDQRYRAPQGEEWPGASQARSPLPCERRQRTVGAVEAVAHRAAGFGQVE